MPYRITRHADDLLWVVVEGHFTLDHAEAYFCELWSALDGSPNPTDLLVDGRRAAGASMSARRRTEQVLHHPHLGHMAFVVGEHHLLLFGPLVKLVSGIGLFGHDQEALAYLRGSRSLPSVKEAGLPGLPPPPAPRTAPESQRLPERSLGGLTRPLPPPPASRVPLSARVQQEQRQPLTPPSSSPPGLLGSLTSFVDGISDSIQGTTRRGERDG